MRSIHVLFACSVSIGLIGVTIGLKQSNKRSLQGKAVQPVEGLTVFIHGTVGSSINFCNPFDCLTKSTTLDSPCSPTKTSSLSTRIVDGYRNHPNMSYDQLLDSEGLVLWDTGEKNEKKAASYVIPAYKKIAKITQTRAQHEVFALFGWSGLLTQQARKDAGYALYNELIEYQKQQMLNGREQARIQIIAHSHGGNVALWLADAEKNMKKGLQIESLVMLGTPVQIETSPYIANPMFSSIYLCYSLADGVQCADYISTQCHKSFARMQDLVDLDQIQRANPHLKRHDVLLSINQKNDTITHINMWLCGRSTELCPAFGSLPWVITTPLLLATKNAAVNLPSQLQCSMDIQQGTVSYSLYHRPYSRQLQTPITWDQASQVYIYPKKSKKLYQAISYWANRMDEEWRPFDSSRNLFWNRKHWDIIKSFFGRPKQ